MGGTNMRKAPKSMILTMKTCKLFIISLERFRWFAVAFAISFGFILCTSSYHIHLAIHRVILIFHIPSLRPFYLHTS